MPKLWTETLEEHRRAVHDATLDTTAALAVMVILHLTGTFGEGTHGWDGTE